MKTPKAKVKTIWNFDKDYDFGGLVHSGDRFLVGVVINGSNFYVTVEAGGRTRGESGWTKDVAKALRRAVFDAKTKIQEEIAELTTVRSRLEEQSISPPSPRDLRPLRAYLKAEAAACRASRRRWPERKSAHLRTTDSRRRKNVRTSHARKRVRS